MVSIKDLLEKVKKDKMIKDSFVLLVATMIMNISGFLYHFVMGRLLDPAKYGVLGAILSILYILLVPFYVIQTSISKFIAGFKAKKDYKSISNIFSRSCKKLFFISIITIIIILIISPYIAKYLNIPVKTIWVVSIAIPFMFLLPIIRGLLQGIQNFNKLGWNFVVEAISKFIFGLILVYIGLHVFGAILGIVISYAVSFIVGFILLKKYFKTYKKELNTKAIYKYSLPVFITLLTLTLFYSLDVMLVKHYFDEITSGYYVAFALLGRIAFFASFSIVFVLFPKVVEMHELKKENIHLLKKALLLITIVCLGVITGYLILPKLVVLILFGSKYIAITKYIAAFALVMSLFSYVYVIAFYNLSINRTNFVYYLFILNILEILLIIRFHSSLWQIIAVLLILIFITLIIMILYTFNYKIAKIISKGKIYEKTAHRIWKRL
ncbi:oligosaccharide flippase family protein [Candidatus Woesearchaeota archaeon]|nr:oligosaccharide flippase family protein [Candidatus Woesearchaeota archaeon]